MGKKSEGVTVKSDKQIEHMMSAKRKAIEAEIGMPLKNGQAHAAVKRSLAIVMGKSHDERVDILAADRNYVEQELGIKIRNGQGLKAFKRTLAWSIKGGAQ